MSAMRGGSLERWQRGGASRRAGAPKAIPTRQQGGGVGGDTSAVKLEAMEAMPASARRGALGDANEAGSRSRYCHISVKAPKEGSF